MIPIFHNPNDNWQGYDPYKGMTDKERMRVGCWGAAGYVIGIIVAMALCFLFNSCTTTQYVPVTETHTEHHWHTDSVKERDSTHTERNTIIREVDSAAMAKYGIQMERNQRAWLVLQREMENRLRELEHMSAHKDTVHDSIPVPYPVTKYVERKLTFTQKSLMMAGALAVILLILFIAKRLKDYLL